MAASTSKSRKRKADARRRTCGAGQRRHWAPWIHPIGAFLSSTNPGPDSAADPKRPPNPRGGRWSMTDSSLKIGAIKTSFAEDIERAVLDLAHDVAGGRQRHIEPGIPFDHRPRSEIEELRADVRAVVDNARIQRPFFWRFP